MLNGLINSGLLGCPVCGQPYRAAGQKRVTTESGVMVEYDALTCDCGTLVYVVGSERPFTSSATTFSVDLGTDKTESTS